MTLPLRGVVEAPPYLADPDPAPMLSPETCVAIFHEAVKAGDADGVQAALTILAPQDPHKAQKLLDSLGLALAVAERMGPQ